MRDVVTLAAEALADAGAWLEPGLSGAELSAVQAKWGIVFCADHAALLGIGVPVGDGWLDWRHDPDEKVRERLRAPVDGLLFDVTHNEFWPASWGERPADGEAATERAATVLAGWPRLLPLFGHRYLPAGPYPTPSPVLSVVQSDVIWYGSDLLEWVQREFLGVPLPGHTARPEIANWSRLADGYDDYDF